uniref:Ras-associating domain-containing protein n=1 Tax=Mesocestoides corti TaxID=53468 RepID=A0A5K3G218_MESCO
MVDVAMKNCEKSNGPQIDLESWIKVLKKGKSASEIRDTRTAFREAGINFEYFEKPKTIK